MKKIYSLMFLFLVTVVHAKELGDGGGSGYPSEIDTDTTQEAATGKAYYYKMNDSYDTLLKIQTELGTNPRGNYSDIKTRLNVISIATGSINTNFLNYKSEVQTDTTTIKTDLTNLSVSTGQIVTNTSDITALKLSTTNIYEWDSGTTVVSRKSNAYIVYGSSTSISTENRTIVITPSINNIFNVILTTKETNDSAGGVINLWQSSFTVQGYYATERKYFWQAIVR